MASELDPPAAAVFRSLAEAMADAAPDGCTAAVLTCDVSAGAARYGLVFERPDGEIRNAPPLSGLMDRFREDLRKIVERDADGAAGIEVTVRASGDYTAVVSPRGGHQPWPGFGCQIFVIDHDHLPPQPGEEQEGPADPAPAGDPEEAVRLLREVLALKQEIVEHAEEPRPPVAPERLTALGAPADLAALYGVTDGHPLMFNGYEWMSLDELRARMDARLRWWPGWELGWDDTVLECDPPGTVRRVTGHPRWFPFAHDYGGNYLVADMAPAANGRPGQIVRMGRDYDDGPSYLADSVTGLLRMELNALRRGDYSTLDDEYVELGGPEWEEAAARNARERSIDARRATLASVGPQVQRLTVHHGGDLDLDMLRNAPGLCDLQLECRDPDLRPLLDLPLHRLHLTVDTVDLAPLARHPELRSVTLRTERPVSVAPLATLPRLHGLDLSEAVVADLGKLADIETLRFLMLTEEQWRELRSGTDRLPPLAAAGLAGEDGLERALRWASGFPTFRAPDELTFTGRLER
ncbi:SMI1/KNR4 family protein [Thermomonospora cellulosilytica]|uniref:Knr4/Smi1-like domain-containing protein n=1 Tax=Thermomonospora cellulosilytica TaxID=1411118 RepID=A0A7W3MYP1_9ACTN|nr:SMI1/KNR4 family protein [Thermomonospora cellulosilytica]MBA9004325.1 hypothetical protein [Thermomonospora cellulosilytica]